MAYIDREKTIKDIESKRLAFDTAKISVAEALRIQGKAIREAIENAPSADVVEVVRCSECKYNPNYKRAKGMVWCRKFRQDVRSDGFCSYGKRRTDDGNL